MCSHPAGYPREPLEVRAKDLRGLNQAQVRPVLDELRRVAAQQARRDNVAGFDVIQAAEQALQVLNGSQADEASEGDDESDEASDGPDGSRASPPTLEDDARARSASPPAGVEEALGSGSLEGQDWAHGGFFLDDLFEGGWDDPAIAAAPIAPPARAPERAPPLHALPSVRWAACDGRIHCFGGHVVVCGMHRSLGGMRMMGLCHPALDVLLPLYYYSQKHRLTP